MVAALVAGIAAGYAIAIPVGAIALVIIETGLRRGLRAGLAAGAGAATADAVYALVAVVFGAAVATLVDPYLVPLRVAAVVVLVLIALRTMRAAWAQPAEARADEPPAPRSLARTYTLLVGLTLLNPATIAYFAALVLGLPGMGEGPAERLAFVVGVGVSSLTWQSVLAVFGATLHRRLSPRARRVADLLGAVVILVFAVVIAASIRA